MNLDGTKRKWLKNPTSKELAIVFITWLIGVTFVFLAATNFFRESFYERENIIIGFLIICATIVMMKVTVNFYKSRK
jgi:ABC-type maltose transport system permease subunit